MLLGVSHVPCGERPAGLEQQEVLYITGNSIVAEHGDDSVICGIHRNLPAG